MHKNENENDDRKMIKFLKFGCNLNLNYLN